MKRCTTFWGLVSAYWLSDRWREAWGLTVVVLAITLLISKAAVWAAKASADFIASLAEFHRAGAADPARVILLSALAYFGIASRAPSASPSAISSRRRCTAGRGTGSSPASTPRSSPTSASPST